MRKLPAEFFHIASEVASMDQQMANAHVEWQIEKEQLRRKVEQDARTRG